MHFSSPLHLCSSGCFLFLPATLPSLLSLHAFPPSSSPSFLHSLLSAPLPYSYSLYLALPPSIIFHLPLLLHLSSSFSPSFFFPIPSSPTPYSFLPLPFRLPLPLPLPCPLLFHSFLPLPFPPNGSSSLPSLCRPPSSPTVSIPSVLSQSINHPANQRVPSVWSCEQGQYDIVR